MRKYIILAVLAVFMTGCASRELGTAVGADGKGAGSADTEIAIEPALGEADAVSVQDTSVPPDMRIEIMTDSVASVMVMTKGTYCWTAESEDGLTGVGTCVDCISPDEMVEDGLVHAWINSTELAKPPKVLLTNGGEIVSVECFGGGQVQEVEFTAEGEIILPEEPIGCAYSVNIRFEQGTCSYIFAVDDHPVDNGTATDPVEGQTTPAFDPTAGQVTQHPSGLHDPENVVYAPEPPEVEILATSGRASWTNITAKCGYYWEGEVNGNVHAVTADSPSPYQLANADWIKLGVVETEGLTEDLKILLPEDGTLECVKCHSETEEQMVDFMADGTIKLPEEPIGSVYSFDVSYPNGKCTYVFVTGIEPSFPEYDEDGIWHANGKIYYSTSDDFSFNGVIATADKFAEVFGAESKVYNRRYFEQGALLVYSFQEGSGSVSHEYIGIDKQGNVLVKRITPEIGTCDMAYYQLVVEIPQAFAGAEYSLRFEQNFEGFSMQPIDDEGVSAPTEESGDIALVLMYSNYAWGYQCSGTFFDRDGIGYDFDFSDMRDISDEDTVCLMIALRQSALSEQGTTLKQTFSADDMEFMLERLEEVDENAGFDSENIMCDYGQRTLYGVRYEDGTAKFIRIYSYGDMVEEPTDKAAEHLYRRFSREIPFAGR